MSDAEIRRLERAVEKGEATAEDLARARVRAGQADPGLVVSAWHVTPSEHVPDHEAVDVDLDVTIAGVEYEGEAQVTLAWDRANERWAAYGDSADTWVAPDLLAWISERARDVDQRREWLRAIESEAARIAAEEVE